MNLFILTQYKLIKQLYRNKDAMDIMLSVEDFFDVLNLYVFPNWFDAEVVDLDSRKYYTIVTLKTPYEKMPHPKGAVLLTKFDCKVEYKETTEAVMRDVVTISDEYYDAVNDKYRPKIDKKKCWCVTVMIPNRLIMNDNVFDLELAQKKMKEDAVVYDNMTINSMPDGEVPDKDVNGNDETQIGDMGNG